ncbi:hypothetical protein [Sphingosinicella sp.]|uniref:hypothetical protein n=1 Tax=Sphingosinicella sp. TaxID=1917971 RepID=UPI004038292B
MRKFASLVALVALISGHVAAAQQVDSNNPTCPAAPNWSNYREMRFSEQEVNGRRVLLAEGQIDDNLMPRLQAAVQNFQGDEIWLRSPGGNARVGNQAGRFIRDNNLTTRIPAGWACFSACNFMFMGGGIRFVDNGGLFMVHMFTHTGNRSALEGALQRDSAGTVGQIEQQSALLASEDNDFLIRMGISRLLLTEVMYQQSAVQSAANRSTRRCLTQQEVNRYNVATVPWQGATAAAQPAAAPANETRRNRRRN